MLMKLRRTLGTVLLGGCLPLTALAGEGVFGWIYTLDLQPKGAAEIEQKIDYTTGQASGSYNLWKSKTGVEYGLTNDVQITGYLDAYSVNAKQNYHQCDEIAPCTAGFGVPESANGLNSYSKTAISGGSAEVIWRLTNPVTSPIGVGLYFEPSIGTLSESVELRLLLQSNFLDDRLILAANFIAETEKFKFDPAETIYESSFDIRYGASYRFAPNWFAGVEGRFHNDFEGSWYGKQIQRANFIGPNLHYGGKDFWVTAAWLYQLGGQCWEPGDAECSNGRVWDSHGQNQFMLKVGMPLQ